MQIFSLSSSVQICKIRDLSRPKSVVVCTGMHALYFLYEYEPKELLLQLYTNKILYYGGYKLFKRTIYITGDPVRIQLDWPAGASVRTPFERPVEAE